MILDMSPKFSVWGAYTFEPGSAGAVVVTTSNLVTPIAVTSTMVRAIRIAPVAVV